MQEIGNLSLWTDTHDNLRYTSPRYATPKTPTSDNPDAGARDPAVCLLLGLPPFFFPIFVILGFHHLFSFSFLSFRWFCVYIELLVMGSMRWWTIPKIRVWHLIELNSLFLIFLSTTTNVCIQIPPITYKYNREKGKRIRQTIHEWH